MERIVTIKKMLSIIELLPADPPDRRPGIWYLTQKEHWLGWLVNYDGPGAYGRTTTGPRHAKMVYNRIVCGQMLEWLIRATRTKPELHAQVAECLKMPGTMNQQSAAIRKLVSWEDIAPNLPEPKPIFGRRRTSTGRH